MESRLKSRTSLTEHSKQAETVAVPIAKARSIRPGRERVLVEFTSLLLKRADEAASGMDVSRSELIRTAVEQLLDGIQRQKFETELADAYRANAGMSLAIREDFAAVDREGF